MATPAADSGHMLCCSEQDVRKAVKVLQRAAYLVLDCEGRNLGREDGVLSLICVGTPAGQVYLFDAVSMRVGVMQLVLDLLCDEKVVKIMWDGRMDYLEILLGYGGALAGVLDLQIAEVVSRYTARAEKEDERLGRLQNSFFGSTLVRSLPVAFEGAHLVIGMQKCLDLLGLGEENKKDPVVQAMHANNQTHRWLERPLEPRLAAYAAQDIRLLALLYNTFGMLGWIFPEQLPGLMAQSARYIALFRTREASVAYSRRRAWTVLPLNILDAPMGTLFSCETCNRTLSKDSFLLGFVGLLAYRNRFCRVCWVVGEKRREDVRAADKWIRIS
ncbi:hypothetical protein CALCODRAFT_457117 [Calocera cornea HHB12733]|uniref:3'-5' exonuclease domain-containing protein n=1 Tax=Calocera cornea HHB12733 TaxID=1353952 RepID=A0A165E695_9BASI|nr:hypothetical protein CALCODRAFT_457117 [Calocera cornea HHB12733]